MANIVERTTLMVPHAEAAADWYEHVFAMKRWVDTPFALSGRGLAAGAAGMVRWRTRGLDVTGSSSAGR